MQTMQEEEKVLENTENIDEITSFEDDSDIPESRIYEVGFLLDGDLPEESISGEVQKIKDVLETGEYRFISEGIPHKRDLEYTITVSRDGSKRAYDNAYFGWVKYERQTNDIKEVQDKIRQNQNVVRFILVKAITEDLVPFKNLPKKETEKTDRREISEKVTKEPISISKEELDKTIEELVID